MRQKTELQVQQTQLHFPSHLCLYILSYFSLPLFPHSQLSLLFTYSPATTCHPYSHAPLPTGISAPTFNNVGTPWPFPIKCSSITLLGSLPLLLFPLSHMPCSSHVTQLLSQTTIALCHLGPFSVAPASPPPPPPCLLPISLILFYPFPVFGLPSSGSAVLLSHLIFSFIGLYSIQVVSPFLLPRPA